MNEMREVKAEVWLPLSQGKVAVIDFDDFEKVRGGKWCASKTRPGFYAVRRAKVGGKTTTTSLHRVIMNCPPGLEVNHINGDGLDNRRENLQICNTQQNAFGHRRKRNGVSSNYRGVYWLKLDKRWQAKIRLDGLNIYLGRFDSEEAAARAYDVKARELFGEHSKPNFPEQ